MGGLEYFSPNIEGLSFKLEYDPYDYMSFSAKNLASASFDLRSKDSNLNYGISYVAARFLTIDLSYIKGNTLNLNFNYAISFNKDIRKKQNLLLILLIQNQMLLATNKVSIKIFYLI